jgi:hypothetical protein
VGGWVRVENKAKLSPAGAGAWAELGNILFTYFCALIEGTTEFVESILSTNFCVLRGTREFVEKILSTNFCALIEGSLEFV